MTKLQLKKIASGIEARIGVIPLFAFFLILKVFGVVGWSWWVVCSPLWFAVSAMYLIGLISVVIRRELVRYFGVPGEDEKFPE
jgi:hypothetical protein